MEFREGRLGYGAKATVPPRDLLTIAARLQQNWNFRLGDLNVVGQDAVDWQGADILRAGGMLPRQVAILELVAQAKQAGVDSVSVAQIQQKRARTWLMMKSYSN